MSDESNITDAGRQYLAAYAAHYTNKDLREAIELYVGVIAAHPRTQEATYSRSQIRNIVTSVVPRQELLDAELELALVHLARGEPVQRGEKAEALRQKRVEVDRAWDEAQRVLRKAERERRASERRRGR